MSNAPTVSLPPWVERPTLDIDLSRPISQLAADLPAEARAAGAKLLRAILPSIPKRRGASPIGCGCGRCGASSARRPAWPDWLTPTGATSSSPTFLTIC